MEPRFQEKKVTELAAHFLYLGGGAMEYLKLLKLIYLTDRLGLERHGHLVSTDHFVSMKHGPVPSCTYNLITEQAPLHEATFWSRYIEDLENYRVGLVDGLPVPRSILSEGEVALVNEIYDQFGQMDVWTLRDYTHTLGEWEDPRENPDGRQSTPIPLRRILKTLGRDTDFIRRVNDEVEVANEMDAWFSDS
jgi:uncharacterized phage-associated protein